MRSSERAFLGWIVLVLYFASTTVASRTVVVCLEVDGSTAIEFAGDHGQCLVDSAECGESCCDSCPCEDSSLAVTPALVVKKDPPPSAVVGTTPDMPPWIAARPCLHARTTPTRPDVGADLVGDVTMRSLRTVVLLL